jgi:outer membrane immunogenic protein
MRLRLVAATVLALIGIGAPAQAADIYGRPRPYTVQAPLNMYNWAGPYVGANFGYATGDVTNSVVNPAGFAGGIQGGHNWQFGQWVVGLEGDFQGSGADDRFAAWKFSNPWFGTLRGRGGYAINNILIYGTGGLAFGNVRAEAFNFTETHTAAGWTLGVGAEVGITQNWSAKAEYLFVNLNNSQFALTGLPHGYQFNLVRLGVNYRF